MDRTWQFIQLHCSTIVKNVFTQFLPCSVHGYWVNLSSTQYRLFGISFRWFLTDNQLCDDTICNLKFPGLATWCIISYCHVIIVISCILCSLLLLLHTQLSFSHHSQRNRHLLQNRYDLTQTESSCKIELHVYVIVLLLTTLERSIHWN